MSDAMKSVEIYRPLSPHQTRLICLIGHDGMPESAIKCILYTADILHIRFRQFFIHSKDPAESRLVDYDALSYTWGEQDPTETIVVNDLPFKLRPNLLQALQSLREEESRFMWVDAICINQEDKPEKAFHIPSMFAIFQVATRVIAWLGPMTEQWIYVNSVASGEQQSFEEITNAVLYLYDHPYFRRIWIQQEIYATDKLSMYAGTTRLQIPSWMWTRSELETMLKSKTPVQTPDRWETLKRSILPKGFFAQETASDSDEISAQLVVHCEATMDRFRHHYLARSNVPIDPLATLLRTGTLEASLDLDYVYGIVNLTSIPKQVMTIPEWLDVRPHTLCIPVDYSIKLDDLYTALTWYLLMQGACLY